MGQYYYPRLRTDTALITGYYWLVAQEDQKGINSSWEVGDSIAI